MERTADTLQLTRLQFLKVQENKLENYLAQIRLMSPARLLQKGFAMIRQQGKVIKNGNDLAKGNEIEIILADQEIKAKIIQIKINESK